MIILASQSHERRNGQLNGFLAPEVDYGLNFAIESPLESRTCCMELLVDDFDQLLEVGFARRNWGWWSGRRRRNIRSDEVHERSNAHITVTLLLGHFACTMKRATQDLGVSQVFEVKVRSLRRISRMSHCSASMNKMEVEIVNAGRTSNEQN